MKRKLKRHEADEFCRRVLSYFPYALEDEQVMLDARDDLRDDWPDWCALPMAAAYAIFTRGARHIEPSEIADLAPLTAALIWRRNKMIYQFDPTLQNEIEQDIDGLGKIPHDAFFRLPYPCVFIEAPGVLEKGVDTHGFFVWMECDVHSHVPELRILWLTTDGLSVSMPVILQGETLEDSIDALKLSGSFRAPTEEWQKIIETSDMRNAFPSRDVIRAIQLTLFLCAENVASDIVPTEPRLARLRQHSASDAPRETLTWQVGARIGGALRASRSTQSMDADAEKGTHRSPRPHMRRAHWHHFWKGPRNDESKRELVLHWLAPVAVNINEAENDLPTVITPVRKPQ